MPQDRMLQEILLEQDPSGWRMLVGCILLNLTTRSQVDRVWPSLFERYPTHSHMMVAKGELVKILQPLGLQNRRAQTLKRFAAEWHILRADEEGRRDSVLEMRFSGIGEYARDSWLVFKQGYRNPGVLYEETGISPVDKELRWYLGLTEGAA